MGRKKFREYGVNEILAALEAVVAEAGPEHIYDQTGREQCQYMHSEEEVGCIVGRVLVHLGAQPAVLYHAEKSYIESNWHGLGVDTLLEYMAPTWSTLGYTITDEAASVLMAAQNTQDCGNTWGRALEEAKRTAEELSRPVLA